jgi:hypothetical protein
MGALRACAVTKAGAGVRYALRKASDKEARSWEPKKTSGSSYPSPRLLRWALPWALSEEKMMAMVKVYRFRTYNNDTYD